MRGIPRGENSGGKVRRRGKCSRGKVGGKVHGGKVIDPIQKFYQPKHGRKGQFLGEHIYSILIAKGIYIHLSTYLFAYTRVKYIILFSQLIYLKQKNT